MKMETGIKSRPKNYRVIAFVFAAVSICQWGCFASKYTRDHELVVPEPNAKIHEPTRVTAGIESNFSADMSINGAFVVYTSDRNGNKDIYEKKTNGGYPRQLSSHPSHDFHPVISPDGEKVAFISRRDDAIGDLYILDMGTSLSRLTGNIEGSMERVKRKNTEEFSPGWFPGNEKVVISTRKVGDRHAKLAIVHLDDLKVDELDGLKGEQASVSPDGEKLVYSHKGSLYLYDIKNRKKQKLTSGEYVQDGQPQFLPDGDQIVFVRYAEDNNGDNQINADDHSTIWLLSIKKQLKKGQHLENFSMKPLTSSEFAAFKPSVRGPLLYFTKLYEGGLDIFSIPRSGQLPKIKSLDVFLKFFRRQTSESKRTYLIRAAQTQYAASGDQGKLISLALSEADLLVSMGRNREAKWLFKKIRENFGKLRGAISFVDILELELKARPYLHTERQSPLSMTERKKLKKISKKLKRRMKKLSGPEDVASTQRAKLLQAKIRASEREVARAQQLTRALVAEDPQFENFNIALAALYEADLKRLLLGEFESIQHLIEVLNSYHQTNSIQRLGAEKLLRYARKSKNGLESVLQTVLPSLQNLEIVDKFLRNELVRHYQKNEEIELAVNEINEILARYGDDPETILENISQYVELNEGIGAYQKAERKIKVFEGHFSENSSELRKRYLRIHNQFLLRKAQRYKAKGDRQVAEKIFRNILSSDGFDIQANKGLMDLFVSKERLATELQKYRDDLAENTRDARRLFLVGYGIFKQASQEMSLNKRLVLIEDGLHYLEFSRERNGQISEAHLALAELYAMKARDREKYFERDNFVSGTKKRIELLKDYFGYGEPAWRELAVDSYLSAYFLSERRSQTRVEITYKLGVQFFELQSYTKSLKYFMERLRASLFIPFVSIGENSQLLWLAGKAAFYTENLKIAAVIQKQEVALWSQAKNQEGIARSMDSLALSLREQDQYEEAVDLYNKLAAIQKDLGQESNYTGTLINLAYCHQALNRPDESMAYLAKAKRRLKNNAKSVETSEEEIKLDLGGSGSDAYGFDTITRKILVKSIEVGANLSKNQIVAAANAQKAKLALMSEKRRLRLDAGAAEIYYLEEISVAQNNLAELYNRTGKMGAALKMFAASLETAQKMRPEGRDFPTKIEALNLFNMMRVYARMLQLGIDVKPFKKDVTAKIDDIRQAFESEAAKDDSFSQRALAKLNLLEKEIVVNSSGKNAEERSRKLVKTSQKILLSQNASPAEIKAAFRDDIFNLSRENSQNINIIRAEIRKELLEKDQTAWVYHAYQQNWQLALKIVTRYILADGVIDSEYQRKLYRYIFDRVLQDEMSADAGDLKIQKLLRRFYFYRTIEMANRYKVSTTQLRSIDRKQNFKSLASHLASDELVAVAHQIQNGPSLLMVCQSEKCVLSKQESSPSFAEAFKKHALIFTDLPLPDQFKLYVTGDYGMSSGGLAELLPQGVAESLSGVSRLIFPDIIQLFRRKNNYAKSSVLFLGDSLAKPLVAAGSSGRFWQASSQLDPKSPEFRTHHIVQLRQRFELNEIYPQYSLLEGFGGISLSELDAKMFLDVGMLSIDGYQSVGSGSQSAVGEAESIDVLYLTMLNAGVPSLMISKQPVPVKKWLQFYEQLDSTHYGEAIKQTGHGAQLLGFMGLNSREEMQLAKTKFNLLLEQAGSEFKKENYDNAARAYKEATYLSKYVVDNEEQLPILKSLVEALFKKQDYQKALYYQKQLLQQPEGTQESMQVQLERTVRLAVYSESVTEAKDYLSQLEGICSEQYKQQFLPYLKIDVLQLEGKISLAIKLNQALLQQAETDQAQTEQLRLLGQLFEMQSKNIKSLRDAGETLDRMLSIAEALDDPMQTNRVRFVRSDFFLSSGLLSLAASELDLLTSDPAVMAKSLPNRAHILVQSGGHEGRLTNAERSELKQLDSNYWPLWFQCYQDTTPDCLNRVREALPGEAEDGQTQSEHSTKQSMLAALEVKAGFSQAANKTWDLEFFLAADAPIEKRHLPQLLLVATNLLQQSQFETANRLLKGSKKAIDQYADPVQLMVFKVLFGDVAFELDDKAVALTNFREASDLVKQMGPSGYLWDICARLLYLNDSADGTREMSCLKNRVETSRRQFLGSARFNDRMIFEKLIAKDLDKKNIERSLRLSEVYYLLQEERQDNAKSVLLSKSVDFGIDSGTTVSQYLRIMKIQDEVVFWRFKKSTKVPQIKRFSASDFTKNVLDFQSLMQRRASIENESTKLSEELLTELLFPEKVSLSQLVISYDPLLPYLPFAALRQQNAYLAEKYIVRYQGSFWSNDPTPTALDRFKLVVNGPMEDVFLLDRRALERSFGKTSKDAPGIRGGLTHLIQNDRSLGRLTNADWEDTQFLSLAHVDTSENPSFSRLLNGLPQSDHKKNQVRQAAISVRGGNPVAAAIMFKTYYRQLKNGVHADQAIQAAQKDVRTAFPHPIDWSGFLVYYR